MDPFRFGDASAAPANGYTLVARDGYSPQRDELAQLLRLLRERVSRRRLIRRADVEELIRELRFPGYRDVFPLPPTPRRLELATVRRPPRGRVDREVTSAPTVDMTCSEVLE